jgi:hypothetical protein
MAVTKSWLKTAPEVSLAEMAQGITPPVLPSTSLDDTQIYRITDPCINGDYPLQGLIFRYAVKARMMDSAEINESSYCNIQLNHDGSRYEISKAAARWTIKSFANWPLCNGCMAGIPGVGAVAGDWRWCFYNFLSTAPRLDEVFNPIWEPVYVNNSGQSSHGHIGVHFTGSKGERYRIVTAKTFVTLGYPCYYATWEDMRDGINVQSGSTSAFAGLAATEFPAPVADVKYVCCVLCN